MHAPQEIRQWHREAKRLRGVEVHAVDAAGPRVGIPVIDGSEVKRICEALGQAMGREVSQLDLGVMLRAQPRVP
jgi:hypothetical protein